MNQMNTLKCFFLNQHIKSFHWKCWVVSAFCNNNWERPTEACNNMWCREISFLFLVRARSFKLVSGVFHYWSSPSPKIVYTQGWPLASLEPFLPCLIKICKKNIFIFKMHVRILIILLKRKIHPIFIFKWRKRQIIVNYW